MINFFINNKLLKCFLAVGEEREENRGNEEEDRESLAPSELEEVDLLRSPSLDRSRRSEERRAGREEGVFDWVKGLFRRSFS